MRAYVIVTGVAFGLITLAHGLRVVVEGVHLVTEPDFVLTSLAAVGLCAWALVLLRR